MSILKRTSNDTDKSKKHVRFNLDTNDSNHNNSHSDDASLTAFQRAYRRSILGTKDMFLFNYGLPLDLDTDIMQNTMQLKLNNTYSDVRDHPLTKPKLQNNANHQNNGKIREPPKKKQKVSKVDHNNLQQMKERNLSSNETDTIIESVMNNLSETNHPSSTTQLVTYKHSSSQISTRNLPKINKKKRLKPEWRRPWKLYKVISGHLGWVQSLCMDPSNEYFVSGSGDRTIKIWELSTGILKLTLTGHISNVRGLAISALSPYMFSCGEDKTVKCWDLEQNKVIRSYHGHLSGVYCLSLHPTLNILFTGGRDSSCRCWDIRTKQQIMVLEGHKHTVASVASQQHEPQVITGSHDKTVRTWDLRNGGKTLSVLTNHKKSIRSVVIHPKQYTFLSGAADNIKVWKCPQSVFLRNMNEKSMNIIETMSINEDNVLMSGHQSGHLKLWDYRTGYKFQEMRLDPQPGSLNSEAGILSSTFDITGTRLITGEADKTIKMFKEDKNATPETHPIQFSKNQNENARF